ncbi:MAG TPA: hypothetical protein VFD86_04525 [Nitrospira sp.]|jgi:hypothetical protein|nr:hypothetical protein [Nitrospira sp.]
MKEYTLAFLAGIWAADGLSLLIAPRAVIHRVREATAMTPGIFRWQILGIAAGVVLLILGFDIAYSPLWMITAFAMMAKGALLWLGPTELRARLLEWCLSREDVDYRFWGLGLCALALLLLHALGWIGRE